MRSDLIASVASPWDFPTTAQQATRLEAAGFHVRFMAYFDRPTPLSPDAGGASGWLRMFGSVLLGDVPQEDRDALLVAVDELAAPTLRDDGGAWSADYVRLRFVAEAR